MLDDLEKLLELRHHVEFRKSASGKYRYVCTIDNRFSHDGYTLGDSLHNLLVDNPHLLCDHDFTGPRCGQCAKCHRTVHQISEAR